jgi:anti-sigma factor RsiW
MNHQPFEEWLLSEEPLDETQAQALQAHLDQCQECAPLAQAWKSVRYELSQAPEAAPALGFTQRWQTRQAQRRFERQRRLAWLGTGLNLLAGFTIFIGLNADKLAGFSLHTAFISLFYTAASLMARAGQIQRLAVYALQSVPPMVTVGVWIVAATCFSLLTMLWIFSMWKILARKGENA